MGLNYMGSFHSMSMIIGFLIPVPEPKVVPSPEPQLDESCIWDEGELAVIRKAYKSVRDENRKLSVSLEQTELRLQDVEQKYAQVLNLISLKLT